MQNVKYIQGPFITNRAEKRKALHCDNRPTSKSVKRMSRPHRQEAIASGHLKIENLMFSFFRR